MRCCATGSRFPLLAMPITLKSATQNLTQAEFGELAYEVVRAIFTIRDDLGRLFDEKIYKRELALRFPGVELEVPIEVSRESFTKLYFLDVLVNQGALFEFKTVETLLRNTRLDAILWANIGRKSVMFRCIKPDGDTSSP